MLGGRRWVALSAATFLAGFALAACGGGDAGTETTATDYYGPAPTPTTATTTDKPTATPTPAANVVRITVANGAAKDGIVRETVRKGERVVLVVESDVADHVHVHGYDLMGDVAAGGTVRIRFRADVPGRFEIELEDRGLQIAELTVNP